MRLVTDIVANEIVAKMDNMLRVSEVVGTFGTQITFVKFCNYKWLIIYEGKSFGAYSYGQINSNGVVPITASTLLNVGDLVPLPIPMFKHGTPLNTVEEWTRFETDENEKLPLIWFVTPFNEKVNDYKQTIERNCDVKLFFIHYSNWMELNQTRVNDSIKPLQAIVDEFIATVNRNKAVFDRVKKSTRREFPKFGTETSEGTKQTIFNSTLAAVQLTTTLDLKKDKCC
jgi:hypothetical protein